MVASGCARSSRSGIVGQGHLDDVEGADVGIVALRPRDADTHDRPCGQVDDGGVLEGGGENEQVQRRAARRGHPLHAPGRAPEKT